MNIFENSVDLTDVPQSEWKNYIGNGYRSCHYTTDHERNGQIILFGYDTNGNHQTFICPHRSYIKYNVKYPTSEKDIFGRYVETRVFPNAKNRKRYVDSCNGSLNIIECLPPEKEFLQKMFAKHALDQGFNTQPVRTHYIDIETEMSGQFEFPKTARNRINMITIYDSLTKKYYTWSLGDCEIDFKEEPLKDMPKDNFVLYKFYGQETNLLNHFLNWFEANSPDVLAGWNIQSFDVPYIVNRIERVLGNPDNLGTDNLSRATQRLSPVGRVRIRENNLQNERANKQAEILADIKGIFICDSLVLYRDKFKIKNPLDGGFGLSNVGEAEGLGKKIEYEGNLKTLYENDFQKFYEYNVRDVDLTRKIEEKCKMSNLARMITSFGLSDYNSIYASIGYLVGSLTMFSRTQMKNLVFTSYKAKKDEKGEKYEGAFVFEPIPGLYKDGIATVDFNSLYPSSIRACNLSPETYVGKISRRPIPDQVGFESEEPIDLDKENFEKYYILTANNQHKVINKSELDKLIDEKCIFTRNNTLFLKHKMKKGVVAEWCTHFFNLRKATKKEMQKLEMKLYKHQVPEDEIPITKERIENLDARQQAIKIMINSIYGIIGTPHSPLYNIHMAQTITRTGKFCNINAALHVADVFNERFGNNFAIQAPSNLLSIVGKDGKKLLYVVSGDTDSQFITIRCITDYFRRTYNLPERMFDWTDEWKLKLWEYVEDFVENDLNKFVQNLIREKYHSENPEVLRYSLEYIADTGVYESKKHYGVRKILAEGPEIVDKIKYSGIELKKGNIPPTVKEFLADIYSGVLKDDWTSEDFKKYLSNAYNRFVKLNIDEISFWKGYGTEKESVGFLEMAKGTSGIAKACTFYNQILDSMKLGKYYDQILVGDKVRFLYVKPTNKFGINVLAYKPDQYPKEFAGIFEIDYDTMWDKLIIGTLRKFLVATGFPCFDPRNMNIMEVDDL